jgi:hypothetical protein
MWQRKLALAVLSLAMLLATTATSRAQTTLRYKFKKGDKLQYVLEQKMVTKLSTKTFNAESTANQTIDMTWTVKNADADKATVAVKFERLRFLLADAKEKVTFDSKEGKELEGKVGKAVGPALKATAALEFDMVVDKRGKVEGVKLSEKSAEAVKGLAGTPGSEALAPEELQRTMNQALMPFPAEAIKPGATWKQTLTNKAGFGTVKIDQALEFKGLKERGGKMLAEIAIKPTLSVEAAEKVTVTVKQQQGEGNAYFDPEAGRLNEARASQSVTVNVGFSGQEVSYEMRQSVSMKLQ